MYKVIRFISFVQFIKQQTASVCELRYTVVFH